MQWEGSLTTFQKLLSWRAWRILRNVQTNVLIREECILKNKNKSCPYKKLSVFYNSCLKTFGSHLVYLSTKEKVIQCRNCGSGTWRFTTTSIHLHSLHPISMKFILILFTILLPHSSCWSFSRCVLPNILYPLLVTCPAQCSIIYFTLPFYKISQIVNVHNIL